MNKKGQLNITPSDFTQSEPTQISQNLNLLQRIAQGIAAIVFLILFSPVIVGIHTALTTQTCGNPTVCLFYKFIVPAFILGGIIGAVKYMWSKQ